MSDAFHDTARTGKVIQGLAGHIALHHHPGKM